MTEFKDKLTNGLKQVLKLTGECFEKVKQRAQQQQQIQQAQLQQAQQQQFHNMMMAIMCDIANDLYEALGGVTYPNLKTINTAKDIRPTSYGSNRKGIIGYTYKLQKNTDKKLAPHQCDAIRKYLNIDIHRAYVTLSSTYGLEFGLEYVQNYFPYLTTGMKVVRVKDVGIDIEITVVV